MTFTKERLLKIKTWRETYGPDSNVVLPAEEAEALAQIALAALESRADAEPVAWVMKDDLADADIIFTPAYTSFSDAMSKTVGDLTPLYTRSQPAPAFPQASDIESLATNLMKRIDKITGERHSIATLSSLRVSIVDACRAAMFQGKDEPKRLDAIDSNLVEALRLVQCMLEDYRERNYGDAEGWIRHINSLMSDYSEAHGDDAYSVLHDLLPAAPQQEKE